MLSLMSLQVENPLNQLNQVVPDDRDDPDYYESELRITKTENVLALQSEPDTTDFSSLRNGLKPESRLWRIFTKENDALLCAMRLGHLGMVPFMYRHRNSNRRFYLVTHPLELWQRNQNRTIHYTYEIIPASKPCKIHVELEFNKVHNSKHNGTKMTEIFVKILLHVIETKLFLKLTNDSILILDSSNDTIFFRQLIIYLPSQIQFRTAKESGECVIQACNLIRTALYNDGDIGFKLNIPESDLQMLKIRSIHSRTYTLFINENIYNEVHYFRVFGSTDFETGTTVKLSLDSKYEILTSSEHIQQECLFLASLVTFSSSVTMGERVKPKPKKQGVRYILPSIADSEEVPVKSNVSVYPFLDQFILGVIHPCTVQTVLSYRNGKVLVYCTKEAGYCHNVGRFHSRNKIMIVLLLEGGVFYQKCHDPDCKGFASKSRAIPFHIQQALNITDDWDQCIVEAFSARFYTGEQQLNKKIKRW